MTDHDGPAQSPFNGDLRKGSNAVAAGILVSRLAGLAREIAMARLLGVGVGVEAFKAALRVPNLLQNLLGEGVLSASFVPVYSRMIAAGRRQQARDLAAAVLGILLSITVVIVVGVMIFARPVTRVLAWGFIEGTDRFELTVTLVRIATPGIGVLVVSAWCLAILNAHRRFFLSYVAPALWNLAIITAVVGASIAGLTDTDVATAMAIGALVGSVFQLLIQVPSIIRLNGSISPRLSLRTEGLRTVVARFGQVLAGRGSVQLAGYVDLVAASFLAAGAIAAIGYAQVLYLLPIGLFGMSVAASELPALSTMDHSDRARVAMRLEGGLSRVAFFILPTTVAFVVLGDLVVAAVLSGGRFDGDASLQVGMVLAAYSLGLPASASSRLLQSVLYGVGDAATPARSAAVRVAVAAGVGILLMLPLDAFAVAAGSIERITPATLTIASAAERASSDSLLRLGATGLALGASVGAWVEWWLLRRAVRRRVQPVRMLGSRGSRLLIAALVATTAAVATRHLPLLAQATPRIHGMAAMLLVGVLYVATCRTLRVPEADELTDAWLRIVTSRRLR
ncbi:MAG: murein biosynthesis integral membrane protein MurJ [Nitriliruptoraceae bacterium]